MIYGLGAGAGAGAGAYKELLIITNMGKIYREYPHKWLYDNKDLGKIFRQGETVAAVIAL